jgi:pyruvate kinase
MKKTKIVCTLGPASNNPSTINSLIKAGMNVARLNFSHGTHEDHKNVITIVREQAKKLNMPIAILQDLQGPRFRTGKINGEIKIVNGETVELVYEKDYNPETNTKFKQIPIQNKTLYQSLKKDDSILIEDGLKSLVVLKIDGNKIVAKTLNGGLIKSNKGMNFPGANLNFSALTAKDKTDLVWGIEHKVDFVAFSFVRDKKDVLELRHLIEKHEKEKKLHNILCKDCPIPTNEWKSTCTKIIAKIETVQAVTNFDEILDAVDGIMVARGDLGIEIPAEQVPLIQKRLIKQSNEAGKPVIVATQMLDSMVNNPIPTRAEVSDVANAVLDGTDAVMLSAESANGNFPIHAVQTLTKIARDVEPVLINERKNVFSLPLHYLKNNVEAVSLAISNIADQINADAIVCATTSGFTPRLIARYKPNMPIIALTNLYKTKVQLTLTWGVKPYLVPQSFCTSFDIFVEQSIKFLKSNKTIKKGDKIIFAVDHPFGMIGDTNVIKVHEVK